MLVLPELSSPLDENLLSAEIRSNLDDKSAERTIKLSTQVPKNSLKGPISHNSNEKLGLLVTDIEEVALEIFSSKQRGKKFQLLFVFEYGGKVLEFLSDYLITSNSGTLSLPRVGDREQFRVSRTGNISIKIYLVTHSKAKKTSHRGFLKFLNRAESSQRCLVASAALSVPNLLEGPQKAIFQLECELCSLQFSLSCSYLGFLGTQIIQKLSVSPESIRVEELFLHVVELQRCSFSHLLSVSLEGDIFWGCKLVTLEGDLLRIGGKLAIDLQFLSIEQNQSSVFSNFQLVHHGKAVAKILLDREEAADALARLSVALRALQKMIRLE